MSTTIDTMPAGREMDALVAEKVMGLTWDEKRCRVCGWPLVPQGEQGCWVSNCSLRPRPERMADEPAHYSTNFGMAYSVVEHLRARGLAFDSYGSGAHEAGHPWTDAIFLDLDGDGQEHMARAETFCLAVCRAALKAVGA